MGVLEVASLHGMANICKLTNSLPGQNGKKLVKDSQDVHMVDKAHIFKTELSSPEAFWGIKPT